MTTAEVRDSLVQADLSEPDEISLAEMVAVLMDSSWLIASIMGAVVFIALVYALFAPPVYTPQALVQVNQKEGGLSGLETLSSMLEGTALPVAAEIQLAQSRGVLSAAVQSQHTDIETAPRRFPLIGAWMARRYDGVGPAPARAGMSSYSWGGDRVQVDKFDVPRALYDRAFRLTVVSADSFQLSDPSGQQILAGRVGRLATDSTSGASIAVNVASMSARPGVVFTVVRRELQETINSVARRLSVSEQGSQSGMLGLTLSGNDPVRSTELLAAIVRADVELNRNLKSEQAASQIDYLQQQLPLMQQRVDTARLRLGEFQAKHKVLDLTEESQALLDRLSNVDQAIMTASLQRAQVQQQFAGSSPALRAIAAQQDTLERTRAQLEQQVAKLPSNAQSVLQLQENLEVASNLYSGLLTSIQQLQVVKAGSVGDLSVVDLPVEPYRPSGPRRGLIVVAGLLIGLVAGVGAAFVSRAFLQRVEEPRTLEASFGLPALAVLPFSDEQARRERALIADRTGREPLLAQEEPSDAVIEELRGLRTSLQFLLPNAGRAVVCISGPISGVGKSFISANLGRLCADAGSRVLLIDSDMRRGHLHRYFGLDQARGLSKLLSGAATAPAVIQPTSSECLSVVTAGLYPPNPAELLLRPAFRSLLDYAVSNFDLVIVDAPPVMPVTDGIIVAREASLNILVTKAGVHRVRELEAMLAKYRQNGIRPDGFVMNCVRPRVGGYGYYYAYRDEYKSRPAEPDRVLEQRT